MDSSRNSVLTPDPQWGLLSIALDDRGSRRTPDRSQRDGLQVFTSS